MMLVWGLWLLNPAWKTFNLPQYAVLKELMDEWAWGLWSVGIAVVRFTALWVNGRSSRTPLIRLMCCGLGVLWWLVLIALFLATPMDNPPAGFAWYPIFVAAEMFCLSISARDAYHTRAFKRPSWVGGTL